MTASIDPVSTVDSASPPLVGAPGGPWTAAVEVAAAIAPMPTVVSSTASSMIQVERRLRSLIHSALMTRGRVVR
jgi:hypothetical protein